jgi:hypothetical protein
LTPTSVGFERWVDGLVQWVHADSTSLVRHTWSHLVVVFDGSMMSLYVNGMKVGSDGPCTAMGTTALPFAWGTMQGSFDELAVYDHPLSPVRVLAHFSAASQAY